ncbi:unnamed protein product [Gordionus sp. m RMFG-2023]
MSVLEKITSASIELEANINKLVIINGEQNNYHTRIDENVIGDNNIEKEITTELMEFQKNLYCYIWEGVPTNRVYAHKNFVDKKEYKAEYYPKFCSGWGYLMSHQLAGTFTICLLSLLLSLFLMKMSFGPELYPKKLKGFIIRH